MEDNSENIIKLACRELGLTYRELAEKIGYTESNLRKCVSTNKVSKQLTKSIEMFMELEQFRPFKQLIKNMIKEEMKKK